MADVANDPVNAIDPTGETAVNCTQLDDEPMVCSVKDDGKDYTTLKVTRSFTTWDGEVHSRGTDTSYHRGNAADQISSVVSHLAGYGADARGLFNTTGLVNGMASEISSNAADFAARGSIHPKGPIFRTDSMARRAASRRGWQPVKGIRTKAKVFRDPKTGKLYTRDRDGHNGGAWKEIDKNGNVLRTVDKDLNVVK